MNTPNETYSALNKIVNTRKTLEEIKSYILEVTQADEISIDFVPTANLLDTEDVRLDWSVSPFTSGYYGSIWVIPTRTKDIFFITELCLSF
jgi:hypothetical protein